MKRIPIIGITGLEIINGMSINGMSRPVKIFYGPDGKIRATAGCKTGTVAELRKEANERFNRDSKNYADDNEELAGIAMIYAENLAALDFMAALEKAWNPTKAKPRKKRK